MSTLEQVLRRIMRPLGKTIGNSRGTNTLARSVANQVQKAAVNIPPDQLAAHLVKSKVAAWAVAHDGSQEILIERGTGAMLLDFRGKPITRRRNLGTSTAKGYQNTALSDLKQFEGVIGDMYLDSGGNATVGIGHLIPNEEAAKRLNFVNRGSSQSPHPNHVANAYRKVKRKIDWREEPWRFRGFTGIEMSKAEITILAMVDIDQALQEIKRNFPHFETYPLPAKRGLIDMVFNLGITRTVNKFVIFGAAVRRRDWKVAAQESNRLGVNNERNQFVQDLLLKALAEEPFFVRPQLKKKLVPNIK